MATLILVMPDRVNDYRAAINAVICLTAASTFNASPLWPYSAEARVGSPETPLPSKPP